MANIRVAAQVVTSLSALIAAATVSASVHAPSVVATEQYQSRAYVSAISIIPSKRLDDAASISDDLINFDIETVLIEVATVTEDVALTVDTVLASDITLADAAAFGTGKDVVDSLTVVDAAALAVTKPDLTDDVTLADTATLNPGKVETDSVTGTDEINQLVVGKTLTDAVTIADAISAFGVDTAVDSTAAVDSITAFEVTKPDLTDAVTVADTATLAPGKVETDSVTAADAIDDFVVGKALTDEPVVTDDIAKDVVRPDVVDAVAVADDTALEPGKVETDTVVAADTDPVFDVARVESDTATIDDTPAFDVARVDTDSVTATDAAALAVDRVDSDSATVADAVNSFDIGKGETDTVAATDEINDFTVGKTLTDEVTIADALSAFNVDTAVDSTAAMDSITEFAVTKPDVTDAVTVADALSLEPGKVETDAVTVADDAVLTAGKDETDAVTTIDSDPVFAVTKFLEDFVTMFDEALVYTSGGAGYNLTPEYVAQGSYTESAGSASVPPPSGIQNGDFLLLFVETANYPVTAPSGWTEVGASPQGQGTANTPQAIQISVFYKFTAGTESNVTLPSTGDHQSAVMLAYRNVAGDTPVATSSGQTQTATTAVQFTGGAVGMPNTRVINSLAFSRTFAQQQFSRPDSDVTSTQYTGDWADIDEATPSDTDLAFGAINSSTPVLEVHVSNPAVTPSGTTGVVRWRSARRNGNGSLTAGNSFTATCTLLQGSTTIASDSYTTGNLSTREFTFNYSSISDFTDLRLRFNQTASGGNNNTSRSGLAVTWAEIEFPAVTADGSLSGWANSSLTGITERVDSLATTGLGGGLAIADGVFETMGSFAATTATNTAAVTNASVTLALKGIFVTEIGTSDATVSDAAVLAPTKIEADAVTATDAINLFDIAVALTEPITITENVVLDLIPGQSSPLVDFAFISDDKFTYFPVPGTLNSHLVHQPVVNGEFVLTTDPNAGIVYNIRTESEYTFAGYTLNGNQLN